MTLYCTCFNMLCNSVFPRISLIHERYTWNTTAAYWWMWYWTFAQGWWWRFKNSEMLLSVAGWVSEILKDHFSSIFSIKQCKRNNLYCLTMRHFKHSNFHGTTHSTAQRHNPLNFNITDEQLPDLCKDILGTHKKYTDTCVQEPVFQTKLQCNKTSNVRMT